MKKLLILVVGGTVTGLALALLLLVLEFGGVDEHLTPYRPEGLNQPKSPAGQRAAATSGDADPKQPAEPPAAGN